MTWMRRAIDRPANNAPFLMTRPRAGPRRGVRPGGGFASRHFAVRRSCAVAVASLLTAAACAHRPPAGFDPAVLSAPSCRQVEPFDAPPPLWSTPADPDSRSRLSRWCDTVGPVFFKPHPASVARRQIDRLAIVSWNIHEGSGDVDGLIRRLRRGEFTAGEPIDHFVLLLQEATRRDGGVPSRIPRGYPAPRRIGGQSDSRNGDVRRFAEEGFAVLYAPSMRNGEQGGSAEDRGNAIVSTLSLTEPVLIELPLERQRRVAVTAAIEGQSEDGNSWHLGVVDVHLDTTLALLHGGPLAARRRQAAALLTALHAALGFADEETAAVVAGDLNAWMGRREPAVKLLRHEFPGAPTAEGPTWRGPLGLRASLDHIFVRGPVSASRVTRLPSRFGSDHYPLLTLVRF
jgi:endonuclease/exonuclease/phosphatase family metal-dependent hydrolase